MIKLNSIDKARKILAIEVNKNMFDDFGSFEYTLLCQIIDDLKTLTNTIVERRHKE